MADQVSRRRLHRLSEQEIVALVAARLSGEEIDTLAGRFGVNRSTVQRHLALQGVPKRRWAGRTLAAEQIAEAGRMYAAGARLELVAEQFAVTRVYLRKVLPETGFPIRKGGQQKRL